MKFHGKTLLNCFGCGVLILDRTGKVEHMNRYAEEILGGRSGWRLLDCNAEPLREELHPFHRLAAGEKLICQEYVVEREGARPIVIALNGKRLPLSGERSAGWVVDFMDVTARTEQMEEIRRAKRAVEESQNRLLALVGSIDEIVFEFDQNGIYLNVWTANDSLLRRPRAEILGRPVEEVVGGELGRIFMDSFRRVLESGITESLEYPLEVLGGERWFLARIAPIRPLDGSPPTLSFLARDITERKRMEEELRASESRFHQALENINLAALILEPRGTVVYANDFLLNLVGWKREEVHGRDWFELFVPEGERSLARKRWVEAVCTGRFAGYHEVELLTRGGRRRLMGWNSILIRNGSGRPIGCASIAEDITERRRAEEVLRRSDQMKSEFISTAAHELRTPLTSIMGYAELLLRGEELGDFTPAQRLGFAREIVDKGEVLNEIVNELLDLSRFESGDSVALELVPCRLDEVLQAEVERYRRLFPRYLFELSLEENCPADILIDVKRMEEVMENLLSNAAKYTPPGRCIRVRGRPLDGGYLVSVADQGIGMTREQIDHVFDKFYRADASDTAVGGLGVGMSLARSIIEAHGGRIWVESSPMHGTTVFFTLPPHHEMVQQGGGAAGGRTEMKDPLPGREGDG